MLTPTTPNFNCNSPPFLIKIKRRAKKGHRKAKDEPNQGLLIQLTCIRNWEHIPVTQREEPTVHT